MQALTHFLASRLYGICVGSGMFVAVSLSEWQARRRHIDEKVFWSVVWWGISGGIVGARLYHIVTDFYLYLHDLWATLYIWRGGLSIIGGLIGGVIGAWLCLRRRKQVHLFFSLLDIAALGMPFGQAIGRLGNFFNQELYGLPTNLPWGIVIDAQHRLPGFENVERYHPLFAYEAIALVLFGLWQWWRVEQDTHLHDGEVAVRYVIFYALLRSGLDFLRLDKAMIGGIGVNQVVLLCSVGVLWSVWRYLRKVKGHEKHS